MDEALKTLPPILLEALETGRVWDESGNSIPLDSNVSANEVLQLYQVVRHFKPSQSVEVGLAKGVSTLAILGAIAENGAGHHTVLDPFQANYGNAGIEMVRRAGLEEWWTFHRKFPEEVIPGLGNIQVAFIDGSHLFDFTLTEFVLVDRKLDIGGVVGFHDMWMPSLQCVFRFITGNRRYREFPRQADEVRCSRKSNYVWKELIRKTLSRIPHAGEIFSQGFLRPWRNQGLGNLVFLQKEGKDDRDWRFHRPF